MPYLPPMSVAQALEAIQDNRLALPAIQREFVWKPAQVTALFDSLMRGYPIGSFLSWKVEPATAAKFRFYGFMRNYNELTERHNPPLDFPPAHIVTAVLDGQQRLTALNIGLRGTYAWKRKYGWAKFIENYPARTLHLHLAEKAPENPAGLEYDFRFLTQEQLNQMSEEQRAYWLPVPLIAEASKINTLMVELSKRGVANHPLAMELATDLWEKVHSQQSLYFYEETHQDIERVLDIFIRVNSGGTTLSYSDLLLSIATAQWQDRDARQEIHGLLDNLNSTGPGFRFSQDLVLKSGLVLAGVSDIGFKVKNFTTANMRLLNDTWEDISASLRVAVGLLSDFGLSGATMTARSVLIPIATYVHHRGLTHSYRDAPSEAADREALRDWTLRSLIIPGIWGSSLDVLLRALRETIRTHGDRSFPVTEIEHAMAARGKSLGVTPELIDALLDLEYGDAGTFAVLAILFPHVNTRNVHHVDHVFPLARLTASSLRKAGFSADEIKEIGLRKNALANLELLEGPENISKNAQDPLTWASGTFVSGEAMSAHLQRHALPPLPSDATDFTRFADDRRQLLRALLLERLAATVEEPTGQNGTLEPIEESLEGTYVTS